MGLRDDFFAELERDFRDQGEDSFLYGYLAREKEGRIGAKPGRSEKRRDVYVLLSERFAAIRGEDDAAGKKAYLRAMLKELIRNEKLRPGPTAQSLLDELGADIGGADGYHGLRTKKQKYETLLELLDGGFLPVGLETLKTIHRDLLSRCLMLDARTLLGDASRKNNPRKDRMLDLYCAYQSQKQDSGTPEPSAPGTASYAALPDEDELRELEAFFARLNAEPPKGCGSLLLPVRIDPVYGAALCILGRDYFAGIPSVYEDMKAAAAAKKPGGWCRWTCFYISDLTVRRSILNHLPQEEINVSWTSFEESIEEMLFPHLREALSWYEYDILRGGKAGDYLIGQNGPIPANCPERLKAYFSRQANAGQI